MPRVQIEIPDEAYQKLKSQAQNDDRSLTKYLVRGLIYLSNIPGGYHHATDKNEIIIHGEMYEYLKNRAEKHHRTPSSELNILLYNLYLATDKNMKAEDFKRQILHGD